MDQIKKFIDCYIPTETCNLRCHYCYITQKRKFNNKLAKFEKSPQFIRRALSKERLGGVCLLNLCAGGETLLVEELLDIIYQLLEEGHYIMVVTNGTLTKRFEQIAKFPKDLLKHLFFKFSFHYLELIRINKLEEYFRNIELMKKSGWSFTVEIKPNDELIPYIEDIKKICMKKLGVLPHITIARDDAQPEVPVLSKYSYEEFKKIWSVFDSALFDFKTTIFSKRRKEFCYAGDWMLYLNLVNGEVKQCYRGKVIQNIYEDLNSPIRPLAIGKCCPEPHCYNGHAFLTLGVIPELDTPNYAEMRNRKNGKEEWLQPEMKQFFSTKLNQSNEIYSNSKKRETAFRNIDLKTKNYKKKLKNKLRKIIKK